MFANVEQVAGAFVAFATVGHAHYLLLGDLRDAMVVQLPPYLEDTVILVSVVVTIFRKSIVDHDGVQIISILALLRVALGEDGLNLGDVALKSLRLLLGSLPEAADDLAGDLDLLRAYSELGLAELHRVEEVDCILANADR